MPSPHLRVTQRCLEDDLEQSKKESQRLVRLDARGFKDLHEAVTRFVDMREDDPDQGEPIHGIRPRGKVCSLHVGQGRAVTTWDEEEDVCWLLAWHWFHRNGHPDDCYNLFLDLHNNGDKLLPSGDDYDEFFDSSDEVEDDYDGVMSLGLLEELRSISRELLDEARSHPNVEAVRTFRVNGRQIMCIDALVEEDGRFEDGWISLRLPEGEYLSDEDVYDLLLSVLPEGATPMYEMKFRERDRTPGEIVYRWEQWDFKESSGLIEQAD